MRQDKIIARILLIFSVANIALAAPVVVRQRHLDVARAASQKRGRPIPDYEETDGSSSSMPPHDGLASGWVESSPTEANRIPTQASEAPGLDNEETANSPPEPLSHAHGLTNGWAESSSTAANRITTQASEAPVWDNGATGDLPPGSSSRIPPPHDSLTNGWLDHASLPESPSAAANRIPTQASEAPVWGNGATGDLPPESSSMASGHITTQALGSVWSSGATDNLPPESSSRIPPHESLTNGWLDHASLPESSSAASDRITTQALGSVWGSGATGDLPHRLSSPVPYDRLTEELRAWIWGFHFPPESSSAATNHITTQASGAPVRGNEATGDLPPESSSRISPHDGLTNGWLDHASLPESSSVASDRITTQASGAEGSGNGAAGDLLPESSSAVSDRIATQESGASASSSSDSAHLGDPPPPHQGSAPESLAAPKADRLFGDTLTQKILVYSGVAAVIGGTAAALGYGIHKWTKHPYVSPLSPADM